MKVSQISTKTPPELVGLINTNAGAVFFRVVDKPNKSMMVVNGVASIMETTLEVLLNESPDRKPIYKGETISIEF